MKSLFLALALVSAFSIGLQAQDEATPEVIDATNLEALRAKAGTEAIVEGVVTSVGKTAQGGITFINVGLPKKQGFVGVVYQKSYPAFPDGFDGFMSQKVRIRGTIDLYRGETPQIKINSPDQIQIVTEPS